MFGKDKPKDPREKAKAIKSTLRREGYKLDRDVANMQRQIEKNEAIVKRYGKQGNIEAAKIVAKEIVGARKAKSRFITAKTQLNSVTMQVDHQLALVRMEGAMKASTDVMKSMQTLMKLPQLQQTMMELSKEMTKMGIIEEMVEDTMESAFDDDDLEEAAQEEVDKVLGELIGGQLDKAPDAISETLPEPMGATAAEEDIDEDMDAMRRRLESLKS